MDEKEAEKYIRRKDEWTDDEKENVEKLKKVMKEGKVYGDPLVTLKM